MLQKGEEKREAVIVYKIDQTVGFQIWLDKELCVTKGVGEVDANPS